MAFTDKAKPVSTSTPSFLKKAKPVVQETAPEQGFIDRAVSPYVKRQAETNRAMAFGEQGVASSLFQTGGNIIGSAVAPIVEGVKAVTPDFVERGIEKAISSTVGSGVRSLADRISDIKAVQRFAESKAGQTTARNVEAVPEYLNLLAPTAGKGLAPVAKAGLEGASRIVTPALSATKSAVTEGALKLGDFAERGLQKDVTELLKSTKPLARQVEEFKVKNVDLPKVLSDKQVYEGLKVQNKSINPDKAIEVLQDRIDRVMDAKKGMLPEIDRLVPESSYREAVRTKAYESIRGQFTPADEKVIRAKIDRQINALPEKMKPSEVDAFRAKVRKSARDAKGQLKSTSEYTALENASRDVMFEITDDLPISGSEQYKALNQYVKSMIDTSTFLDKSLRGQKVKGGQLRNYAMRGVGAIAGLQGGVLGSIAGAETGGFIADIITNNALGSSIKMKLIRNITNDPEIIAQSEKLLGELQETNLPLLKAGDGNIKTQIETGRAIELPEKSQSTVDLENMFKAMSDKERTDFLNSLTEQQKTLLLRGRGENPIQL